MSLLVLNEIVAGRAPPAICFSVAEFHKMLADGILIDGQPLELIDGIILQKDRAAAGEAPMTHGKRHAIAIEEIDDLLAAHAGNSGCSVRAQLPVTLSDVSEPEPDLALVMGKIRDYLDHHPGSSEALLVIEVADSSLHYDRTIKQGLYAAAEIREYWIVNLIDDQIEVHRTPIVDERRYAQRCVFGLGEVVPLPLPGNVSVELRVDELVPPRP
ncbi:MAG TPA: Uma2 family endonuclease [Pirellulales bacterium]|nr:Uma2 family endonuclease [Pirellulales bacterium]